MATQSPTTPYQPMPSGGICTSLFGWLQGLFAPATPPYEGGGQPMARGGSFFGTTPVYQAPPVEVPTTAMAAPSAPAPADDAPGGARDPQTETDPMPGHAPGCMQAPVTIVIAAD